MRSKTGGNLRDPLLAALILALLWAALAILALPGAGGGADTGASGSTMAGSKSGGEGDSSDAKADGGSAAGSRNDTLGEGAVSGRQAGPEAAEGGSGSGQTAPEASYDEDCRLEVLTAEGVRTMDLRFYLTGVLLAEMPVTFPQEALKAQAVACRTYALRGLDRSRHPEAAVCTDAHCCQGWADPAQVSPERRAAAEAAVEATDGLALYYDGALIDATFFACSGGRTEDAAAVWGGDLPYLRSVASPGEEEAAHFTDETRIPLEEFQAALEDMDGAVRFPERLGAWVGSVRYTAGGGVAVMELGGRPFRGTQLRKRFGLRSTAFTLELTASEAVFTTRGNGHRVGMSQYGAAAMAQSGADFAAILTWYYQGVEIEKAPRPGVLFRWNRRFSTALRPPPEAGPAFFPGL